MLRISFHTDPFWLDLPHGVRLQVRPPGTAVILGAGAELAAARATGEGPHMGPDPATAPVNGTTADPPSGSAAEPGAAPAAGATGGVPANNAVDSGRLAFTSAVARAAILDWEGVADAEGAPLPVSPAAVDALMAHWPVFAAFERLYLHPALLVVAEGNA